MFTSRYVLILKQRNLEKEGISSLVSYYYGLGDHSHRQLQAEPDSDQDTVRCDLFPLNSMTWLKSSDSEHWFEAPWSSVGLARKLILGLALSLRGFEHVHMSTIIIGIRVICTVSRG